MIFEFSKSISENQQFIDRLRKQLDNLECFAINTESIAVIIKAVYECIEELEKIPGRKFANRKFKIVKQMIRLLKTRPYLWADVFCGGKLELVVNENLDVVDLKFAF